MNPTELPLQAGAYQPAAMPGNEAARLAALYDYAVLDTPAEEAFDDFTTLASRVCGAPVALISLIDAERQWFKSTYGVEMQETPRDWAFCSHAILGQDVFEVEDAMQDARFAGNPLVAADNGLRFYAGAPLITPAGHALGTLCVIDGVPRRLEAEARDTLRRLARQVVQLLELRRLSRRQQDIELELRRREADLERLALVAERTAHSVMITDAQGRIAWFNSAFRRLHGLVGDEGVGCLPHEVKAIPRVDADSLALILTAVDERRAVRVRARGLSADGSTRWLDIELQPIVSSSGEYRGHISMASDVSDLVAQREQARALLETLPVAVMVYDCEMRVQQANARAVQLSGLSAQELIGTRLVARYADAIGEDNQPLPPSERPALRTLADGETRMGQVYGLRLAGGERRWLQVSTAALRAADGAIDGVVVCAVDCTEARRQRQLLSLAIDAARIVPWHWDVDEDVVQLDRAAASAAGLRVRLDDDGEQRSSPGFWQSVHRDDVARVREVLLQHDRDPSSPLRGEFRLPGTRGDWRWMMAVGAASERDDGGHAKQIKGVLLDISDHKLAEQALRVAATTDDLTALPNRAVLADRLQQALRSARRRGHSGALLFIDLDHFKRINDVYGHPAGDRVLQAVSFRLKTQLRDEDTLARMGGDEFMVLLPDAGPNPGRAGTAAELVGRKLQAALAEPIVIDGVEFDLSASIGFTLFPKADDETAEDLVREADTAMYAAKASGRGTQCLYALGMRQDLAQRLALERDLGHAIERRELQIHLQGKWHSQHGLVGAEVLLRWCHPERGQVSPAAFIPVAEDSALILAIGRWVLEEACAWLFDRLLRGCAVPLAVNVSPRQFRDKHFTKDLLNIVQSSGVPATWLTLEITEGVLLDEQAAQRLQVLADAGFRISIDDFGTGYSSLLYLKRLPVHEIKIDRGFVNDLTRDPENATIVQAMLAIARRFEIDVVAEGVETPEQAAFLMAHDCLVHQGFLYDRPGPAKAFMTETNLASVPVSTVTAAGVNTVSAPANL